MGYIRLLLAALIFCLTSPRIMGQTQQGVFRATFNAEGHYLTVELLDDDLAHFELNSAAPTNAPVWTSPMVVKTDYTGPSSVEFPNVNEIATPAKIVAQGSFMLGIRVEHTVTTEANRMAV